MKVLLDTSGAAEFLGLKRRTLEIQRQQGFGPPYIRLGARTIRYLESDLIEHVESKRRRNTSQGGEDA